MKEMREGSGEILFVPPLLFDTGIGYWTGESDEDAVQAALEALARQAGGALAFRCRSGHLHLQGPPDALAAAEAALVALGFTRARGGCGDAPPTPR